MNKFLPLTSKIYLGVSRILKALVYCVYIFSFNSFIVEPNMTQKQSDFSSIGDQVRIVRLTDRSKELGKLPEPGTTRWVAGRKAKVVAAVRSGILTEGEACERYRLSQEEFESWTHLLDQHGLRGLRATRIQDYRSHEAEERAGA
jgi:hypothetical protein